ncbi:hypothetical protein P691DRAFT_761187 [Macrolepiota fuliginosa MF-IS2]|uniref:Alpha/beta-hydrolase n=1 Tax=Macrolepiota fuliginosa MF-IS2 TaxID=1400762 RepID=A0A9P5XBE7_9AGAR|nr:hypothetical protein P691DRAFT_761187 [Macrolepiota fuliginosa MF-IS2]
MDDVVDIAELPAPARRRALSFYVVLLFLVFPFWSAIPLAWTFVTYSLHTGKIWSYAMRGQVCFAIALVEVFFSVYHVQLARQISPPTTIGPGDALEIKTAYARLLKTGLASLPEDGGDEESLLISRPGSPEESLVQLERSDPRAIDFRNSLRNWFHLAPWSSIRAVEVRKWLYWSIFNADIPPPDRISPLHKEAMDNALDMLQKRTGTIFPEGSDPNVVPLRLTIDRTFINWRPITFYAIIGFINRWLRRSYVNHFGVKFEQHENLEYLLRIPKDWDSTHGPRPLVFLHGLGLGLLQYHILISKLFRVFTDRPILIPLQPQISQDFFHPRFLIPVTRHQMADNLAQVLDKLGWARLGVESEQDLETDSDEEKDSVEEVLLQRQGVTMLSHSNGTYVHAWMLKAHPKMLTRSCFVDPVTFCQWQGDVCYKFMYRPAMTGFELVMRYFVGSEIGVANLLQRHFDWVSNTLWYEEIPNARDPSKTMYFLGGKDDILNADRIKQYLASHGIKKGLWYDPEGRHGQALLKGTPGHNEIFRWLQEPEF